MDWKNELNKQPRILVIDDEADHFEVIAALLSTEKYQLDYAISREQGFNHMAIVQPDVILLDVMMPEINGIEICHQIKKNAQWQNIPVLMVTALSNKKDLAKCMSSGAEDLISKPLSGLELRARVRSMVRISQQHQTIQELSQQVKSKTSQLQQLLPRRSSFLPLSQPNLLIYQLQRVMQARSSANPSPTKNY